mgnify:CR=1 FL=1
MKEIYIPTRADQQMYVLLWSSDQIMPVIFGFGFGILLEQVFICTMVGIVIAHFYKKFRDLHADGYLYHFVYWYGCGFPRSKSMINPFITRLIP